jgi:hypothetical protein
MTGKNCKEMTGQNGKEMTSKLLVNFLSKKLLKTSQFLSQNPHSPSLKDPNHVKKSQSIISEQPLQKGGPELTFSKTL